MQVKDYLNGAQHIGLPSICLEDTIKFYKALGFETIHEKTLESGQKVAFLKLNDLVIETYSETEENIKRFTGAWDHLALRTCDIEKAFEAAESEGYEITTNGIEYLECWKNGYKYFFIKGPNEERIEIGQIL